MLNGYNVTSIYLAGAPLAIGLTSLDPRVLSPSLDTNNYQVLALYGGSQIANEGRNAELNVTIDPNTNATGRYLVIQRVNLFNYLTMLTICDVQIYLRPQGNLSMGVYVPDGKV